MYRVTFSDVKTPPQLMILSTSFFLHKCTAVTSEWGQHVYCLKRGQFLRSTPNFHPRLHSPPSSLSILRLITRPDNFRSRRPSNRICSFLAHHSAHSRRPPPLCIPRQPSAHQPLRRSNINHPLPASLVLRPAPTPEQHTRRSLLCSGPRVAGPA